MIEKKETAGISFDRLVKFLTPEFKKQLSKDVSEVKKHFVLGSDSAYNTLHAVIMRDVLLNQPKKKWFSLIRD